MNSFNECEDTSDIVPLCPAQRLFLKPIAKINISVQLPMLKNPNLSISTWEVMEKIRKAAKPQKIYNIKVVKSTLEFIRFETEAKNKKEIPAILARLENKTIKLSGFSDLLKVKAAEAKLVFPTRHVWDSFFREARHMNEMRPGQRPDTIVLTNLPNKWFTLPNYKEEDVQPSEFLFRKAFEVFGEIRCIDIPSTDPYRDRLLSKGNRSIKTFSFDNGLTFEGFIQFKEYLSFVKAMDALKGKKLVYKDDNKYYSTYIKVDFDRTKHMTDEAIRRRNVERERLIKQDNDLLTRERKLIEAETKNKKIKVEEEKIEARKKKNKIEDNKINSETEDRRKKLKKLVAKEEKKLKETRRKLANMALLKAIIKKGKFNRGTKTKKKISKKVIISPKESPPVEVEEEEEEDEPQVDPDTLDESDKILIAREAELREKLLFKYKETLERNLKNENNEEVEASCSKTNTDENTTMKQDQVSMLDSLDKILFGSESGEAESETNSEEEESSSSNSSSSSSSSSKSDSEEDGEITDESSASSTKKIKKEKKKKIKKKEKHKSKEHKKSKKKKDKKSAKKDEVKNDSMLQSRIEFYHHSVPSTSVIIRGGWRGGGRRFQRGGRYKNSNYIRLNSRDLYSQNAHAYDKYFQRIAGVKEDSKSPTPANDYRVNRYGNHYRRSYSRSPVRTYRRRSYSRSPPPARGKYYNNRRYDNSRYRRSDSRDRYRKRSNSRSRRSNSRSRNRKRSYSRSVSRHRSKCTVSRSRSRSRKRSYSRSRSRSRSRRSYSKHRSRSRSGSKRRSSEPRRSRSRSNSHDKQNTRSRNKISERSKSKSPKRSKSRSERSKSRTPDRSRSRPSRSKTPERPESEPERAKAKSKTPERSRSITPTNIESSKDKISSPNSSPKSASPNNLTKTVKSEEQTILEEEKEIDKNCDNNEKNLTQ